MVKPPSGYPASARSARALSGSKVYVGVSGLNLTKLLGIGPLAVGALLMTSL